MLLNILISTFSQTPIYQQIQVQIKALVLASKLQPGEQLPSIRLLAKDLQVGIITVKRAYEELEKEGLVVNIQGRGCFVAQIDAESIKQAHKDTIARRLQELKDYATTAGISKDELVRVLNQVYKGDENDK